MGVAVKIVDGMMNKDGKTRRVKIECRAMDALYREAFTLSVNGIVITIPLTEAQKLIEKVRKSK